MTDILLESALESSHHLADVLRVGNLFSVFQGLLLIVLLYGAIRFSFSEGTAVTIVVTNAAGGNCSITKRVEEMGFSSVFSLVCHRLNRRLNPALKNC